MVATGAAVPPGAQSTIDSYAVGHPNTKGLFAVDGGQHAERRRRRSRSTACAQGVKGGGYDLTPVTQQLLATGEIEFTIDQQPYLQGFFPVLQLYMYKVSQKLTGIARRRTPA